jgi:hypothetical protein
MDNSAIRWMIYEGFNNNHIPHANLAQSIPTDWIDSLHTSLLHINPLTQCLMSLHDLHQNFPHSKASLIIEDSGCQEIAAIMCYDNTTQYDVWPRSLIITSTLSSSQWIPTISCLWEPLTYLHLKHLVGVYPTNYRMQTVTFHMTPVFQLLKFGITEHAYYVKTDSPYLVV